MATRSGNISPTICSAFPEIIDTFIRKFPKLYVSLKQHTSDTRTNSNRASCITHVRDLHQTRASTKNVLVHDHTRFQRRVCLLFKPVVPSKSQIFSLFQGGKIHTSHPIFMRSAALR